MAKAAKAPPKLFGIAPARNEAIRVYKHQRVMDQANKAYEMFGPSAFWGAALSGELQNRFSKSAQRLPPELEARVTAQESAQRRVEELDPELWGAMDEGQRSRTYRRFLAEESFRNGLYEIGSELYAQVSEEALEAEKKQADLEKVEIETDVKGIEAETKAFDLSQKRMRAARGEMKTIYPLRSSDPNTGIDAFIDQQGLARAGDKEFPLGTYTIARPQRPPKAGGEDSTKPLITPTEAGKLRSQQRDVVSQMRAALRIVDIMKESMTPNGSIEILGTAGKISSFITKTVDEFTALARAVAKTNRVPYSSKVTIEGSGGWLRDDKVLDGTFETAAEYAKGWEDSDKFVPESIRSDETQARRYKAALVNLAYAVARSEEPGNPRLSDDDFKRNLEQIAEATTSPETLRRVLTDRIRASQEDYEMFVLQMPNTKGILNPEATKEYERMKSQFYNVFGTPFGTAGQPGPGLTNEETNKLDLGDGFSLEIIPNGG